MNTFYKEKIVYKALEELDEALFKKDVAPFELNVVGGFALMVQSIRASDYTDVDYVGPTIPDWLKELADEIGLRYGLGRGWLNNDVLLAGNDLEVLEKTVGKLEFSHAFALKVISVNALDKECLLRLKVIAVDTSFSAVLVGYEFTRFKDFEDIRLLMESLDYSVNDLVEETYDYVMLPEIFHLIRYYVKTLDQGLFADGKWKKIIANKGKMPE